MRRSEYIALARAEAQKLLGPADYMQLISCITTKSIVFFTYTDDQGVTKIYHGVLPIEFIITPGYPGSPGRVYLWAFHELDNHKHSFYVHTIRDVSFTPGIIDALLDPSKYSYFWDATALGLETITI